MQGFPPSKSVLRTGVVDVDVAAGRRGGQPKPDVHNITLTLIRHAGSEANASDVASTAVPGPPLTAVGQEQAAKLADKLSREKVDGIYASELIRTQQTAAPLAKALGR